MGRTGIDSRRDAQCERRERGVIRSAGIDSRRDAQCERRERGVIRSAGIDSRRDAQCERRERGVINRSLRRRVLGRSRQIDCVEVGWYEASRNWCEGEGSRA